MAGGGGWTNIFPIVTVLGVCWMALGKTSMLLMPPQFDRKRIKSDAEFNKLLHLRFNKAVQDPNSVAGKAVKAGCHPEFRPFDASINPFANTYLWDDEVIPVPARADAARMGAEHFYERWYHAHFTRRVCDDTLHNKAI